ncbi:hypothetical protein [Streptomyces kebangsaanensis]|uniref:hypothetical protein n=1 Tax=Streptomyces kebangsaanensis TaxID=864058 RepID=UPI00093A1B04|nr:hypothetical protein [Streptomyces kebangsaanensis]
MPGHGATAVHPLTAGLPGVRDHMGAVARDLHHGRSCLWIFPDHLVENGTADRLFAEVVAGTAGARVENVHAELTETAVPGPRAGNRPPRRSIWGPPAPGGSRDLAAVPSFGARLQHALEARVPAEDEDPLERVLETLLTGGRTGARWFVSARSWLEPDLDGLVALYQRLTHQVRAEPPPAECTPRLLLAARYRDIPADLPARSDADTARIHWWWGVLGRLDGLTAAAHTEAARPSLALPAERDATGSDGPPTSGMQATSDKQAIPSAPPVSPAEEAYTRAVRTQLRREAAAELAGPDLSLLPALLAVPDLGVWESDGAVVKSIRDALCCPPEGPVGAPAADCHLEPVTPAPGQSLRDAWADGAVEAWEGRLHVRITDRLRSSGGGPAEHRLTEDLRTAVWRAQLRVIYPLLASGRSQLQDAYLRLNRMSVQGLRDRARHRLRGQGKDYRVPSSASLMELSELSFLMKLFSGSPTDLLASLCEALHKARNHLAHHQCLGRQDVDEVCRALARLDGIDAARPRPLTLPGPRPPAPGTRGVPLALPDVVEQ